MRTITIALVILVLCGSLTACGPGPVEIVTPPAVVTVPPKVPAAPVDVLAGAPTGGFSGDQYLATELSDLLPATPGSPIRYGDFVTVTDQTGGVQVQVPRDWGEVDGRPGAGIGGRTFADVRAAPDLGAFEGGWSTPGVIVNATSQLSGGETEVVLLDELVGKLSSACDYDGRRPYPSRAYVAHVDVYTDCAGSGTASIVVGVAPPDRSFAVRVRVNAIAARDLSALDRLLASAKITGRV